MKTNLLKNTLFLLILIGCSFLSSSFDRKETPLKKTASGLEYILLKDNPGGRQAMEGDQVRMHTRLFVHFPGADSVIMDSRKANKNAPVTIQLHGGSGNYGDIAEGIMLMKAGDSAIFFLSVDSLIKYGASFPPYMRAGKNQKISYMVSIVSLASPEELVEMNRRRQQEQDKVDDAQLKSFIERQHIKAEKTSSGIYYSIEQKGTGPLATAMDQSLINYTIKDLQGKVVDANQDKRFKHPDTRPVKFSAGSEAYLPAWSELIPTFPKGTKATLYIPSRLGYGVDDNNGRVKPNSNLICKIEVVDIKPSPEAQQANIDDGLIRQYLAKNNQKATRTASGLYYNIVARAIGESPKKGQTAKVVFTGHLMDGTIFGSSFDTVKKEFHPFEFKVGQGNVLKGLDEGIQFFAKGTKGTLYIPSGLAYGTASPTKLIPENAILIFDMELIDIIE